MAARRKARVISRTPAHSARPAGRSGAPQSAAGARRKRAASARRRRATRARNGRSRGARETTRTAGSTRMSSPKTRKATGEKWSRRVMEKSDAMDLQAGVFKLKSAAAIARSLKKSSEASHRRKSSPFRSAMSMLNFEINRAGTNLSSERLQVLNRAKTELRKAFSRPS